MATILYTGTAGTNEPTRASMPFHAGLGAVEAGHKIQIALIGEATYLMKDSVAAVVQGVAVPPFAELLSKALAGGAEVFV